MVGEEGEGGAVEDGEVGGMAAVGVEQPVSGVRRQWIDSWGRRRPHQSRCTSMSVARETPPR